MASKITTQSLGEGKALVHFSGRIDVSLAGEIEADINKFLVAEDITSMVVNFSNVEYISSSGFRVLIATMRKLKSNDGSLKLCSLRPEVERVFEVVEMTSLFEIFETEDEALKQL